MPNSRRALPAHGLSHRGTRIVHPLQERHQKRRYEMTNGNNNGHNPNGTSIVPINGKGHRPAAAIVGEHDPASSAGQALFWDGLSPAVANALNQPLDPGLVSQRKGRGGRVFDYLEGHVVIDQANAIFGYGAWGVELVDGAPRHAA